MSVILEWLLTPTFGTVFVTLACVYLYIRHILYNYWKTKGVVYLEPTVPTGNVSTIVTGKTSTGQFYADAYTKMKNHRYFGIYGFMKPILVVADPDLIKLVLSKNFQNFHDRGLYCNEEIDPLSGHLFFLPGEKWKTLRAKITPTFTSAQIKRMFLTVMKNGHKLTNYLKPKAESHEVIEIKDLYARFGTDIIISTAFGIDCNSLENPNNNEYRYWGNKIFAPNLLKTILLSFAPKVLDIFSLPLIHPGVTKFFMNAFKENVEYRRANNVSRPDFLNLLIQLMKKGYVDDDNNDQKDGQDEITNESYGTITMTEAAAQAYVFFFAGFETTSSTITFCLYELALHQDIQDKVVEDIDKVLEKCGGLTYDSLQEMTYLHKVVLETLRKYPPLPVLNRTCTEDIALPTTSLQVDKGVNVIIPILGIHMNPEIYPEPEKFDPERFNAENIASRHPYVFLPFGIGPRNCIGMRFGYAQTKVGLISMLSKYRVKSGPNTTVPLIMDPGNLLTTAKGGIDLTVELR